MLSITCKQSYNSSDQINALAGGLSGVLGSGWAFDDVIDCFMTTVCTDRDMPQGTNQYAPIITHLIAG
jgi:hypothetical protein